MDDEGKVIYEILQLVFNELIKKSYSTKNYNKPKTYITCATRKKKFLDKVGQYFNVNNMENTYVTWHRISVALNSLGPPKNAADWKTVRSCDKLFERNATF